MARCLCVLSPLAGCTCFPSLCKTCSRCCVKCGGSCADLSSPLCCSFPAQQFLHVHHGGGHDRLVHGQDLGGSAGGGCWSPAGLALQCSSGVRNPSCPFSAALHLPGESQQALSCQLSPGLLLLENSGWADFLALIWVKPELDGESGVGAEWWFCLLL